MTTEVEERAHELKANLTSNLSGAFEDLVIFSEEFGNPQTNVVKDTVLLSSRIFRSLDNNNNGTELDKSIKQQFIDEALEIVDNIIRQSKEKDYKECKDVENDIQERFIRRMPSSSYAFVGEGFSKIYTGGKFKLEPTSLSLRLGEITGVVGENGTGKTTLLRIVAGDLRADSGVVNYPLVSKNKKDWIKIKQAIGYVPQRINDWGDLNTVKKILHFTASIKGIRGDDNLHTVNYLLNRLELNDYKDYRWGELSGGFKLRFELARQLVWSPKLLILDEPLANLDIKAQTIFLNDIRNLARSMNHSMAVLISSQNIYDIESISDNIIFMRTGRVKYSGPVSQIGSDWNNKCFMMEADCSILELKELLAIHPVSEIRNTGSYMLVFGYRDMDFNKVLITLLEARVTIRLFRDISNSTRVLFER